MARLQILELPEGSGDERPPFALIVDQFDAPFLNASFDEFAKSVGAVGIVATQGTIDIPANDVPVDADGNPLFRAQVEEQIEHALGNVTRAANGGRHLAQERTDIARDMDRLAKWKNELLDALGMDRTRDWDDIRNTAAGLRKSNEARGEAIERINKLHQPVEHRGQVICWECSDYDFPGQTTDSPPVLYDQCSTLKTIDGRLPATDA